MAFGNNNGIAAEPQKMSYEDFKNGEQERVQRGFGIYKEPTQEAPQPNGGGKYDFTDDRITNLNRAEYEGIIDSYSGIPAVENDNRVQEQVVRQPAQVQQTQQVVVPQFQVQPEVTHTVEQAPVDKKDDFLASIFGDTNAVPVAQPEPVVIAPTPVISQPAYQPQYQPAPVQQVPQQDMFKKELAEMALHNRVNPNVVFETLKNIPLENLYQFVMGQAGEAKSANDQRVIEQKKRDDALSLNMANFSVTNERPATNVSTRSSYNYDSSSDLY